jgi:hypothetical protein
VPLEKSLLERINEREGENLTPLEAAILQATEDPIRREAFEDGLSRLKRILIYAYSPHARSIIRGYGFVPRAFYDPCSVPGDMQFATYIQLPIVENPQGADLPVREEDTRPFHLFMLVDENAQISAQDAVEWECRTFLKEQFGDDCVPGALKGWNKFLEEYGPQWIEQFSAATTGPPELNDRFACGKAIINALHKWPRTRADWPVIRNRLPSKL